MKCLSFAKANLRKNLKKWIFFDDKYLEIPPPPPSPPNHSVYPFPDSTKPFPEFARRKKVVKLMMFARVCHNGNSEPDSNHKKSKVT